MSAFKDHLDDAVVATWAHRLGLDEAWTSRWSAGLAPLELKARVQHVAEGLAEALTEPYPQALPRIVHAAHHPEPMGQWASWPAFTWVAQRGLDHPEPSLDALATLTPLFSAEFAIRPYLRRHTQLTLARCTDWTRHPDEHVRRLVSEGTRTRLPWGGQLKDFMADPSPVLPLLEALRDDPSEYVRRSVANNLNDLSKDHPERVVALCARWLQDAPLPRQKLVRHALRTRIKAGDPEALALIGVHAPAVTRIDLQLSETVTLGGSLEIALTLELARAQKLVVDYALLLKGARGPRRKVFKGHVLAGCEGLNPLHKRLPIKPVTVRRYYPGRQEVEVLVNGQALARGAFTLITPA